MTQTQFEALHLGAATGRFFFTLMNRLAKLSLMENAKPQAQHEWLKKFIGSWTFESEAQCGPDQPLMKSSGTETVKAVGELWVIGEGKAMYCDATEFINDDERVLTSSIRGENGEWSTFMTARYRRSK